MIDCIDGALFQRMIVHASAAINAQKQSINELNVFPVPDGDTGTNMSLTIGTHWLRAGWATNNLVDALVMLLSSAIAAIYSISRNVICSVTSSPYKFIISGSTVFVHVPACAILILFSYPVHRFSIFPHICLVFSDSFPLLFFFHTNPSIHLLGKMIYSL